MKLSNTQNVLKPLLLFIYLTFIVQTVQAELTSFAAIGDFGQDNAANTNVANMVDGWQPEFVITLGDNRYLNNSFDTVVGSRYCNYLTDVNGGALCPNGSSSENAFFPSLGNNDYSDGGGVNEYLDYFSLPGNGIVSSNTSGNERYYDYIQGPIHFFVINSDVNEADGIDSTSIQAQWLQTQMAASTTPWQVVYLHHAPYSSGTGGTDTTLQWPFAAWGADALIFAHYHFYERMHVDGIPYILNGIGGSELHADRISPTPIPESQLLYVEDFGAMRVVGNDLGMTFEFLSLDDGASGNNGGLLIDTYTIGETPVPLNEDFNSADGNANVTLPDWSVLDEGSLGGASNWTVNGGQLQQTSDIGSINIDPNDLAKPGSYLLHNASLTWADYSVQLSLSSTDDDSIGVMFRYQNSNNYYRFVWNNQDAYRRIEANEGGVFRTVAQDNVPYVVGQNYALNITVQADTLSLSIDGLVIFSQTDSAFANGGIALYSWANNGSNYDDLMVENLGNSSANAAPTVNITAPTNGSSYTLGDIITFSGTANDTEDGNISGGLVWSSNLDGLIGTTGSFNTSTLTEGLHTITASVTDSGSLNPSPQPSITLTVAAIGGSLQLLDENFNGGDGNINAVLADWSVLDEGNVSGPSNWFVSGAQLQQTSNIRSSNTEPGNLAKQGTYLLHNPSLNWTDYSVQLSLSATDNDSIGVMFRYQNSNNYYRFVWNNQDSYRRIEANEGGAFRIVAQDNLPYVVGQTYALNITVQANSISLSIDGVVIFSQTDLAFDNGGIALYSWANNGVIFDDLVVDTVGPINSVPAVTISTPSNSSSFILGDIITFGGTANDTEDGNISANLVWSSNIDGLIGSTGNFNTSALSVGTHNITASATDSGGLSNNDSITLVINAQGFNFTPSVTISAPVNGGNYIEGDNVTFTANGTDTEDGDISSNLSWSSDLDGVIGSGATFNTSTLSVGTHTITANVTDSGGLSDSDSIILLFNVLGFNFTPSVTITAPISGGNVIEGNNVTFTANGTDTEDGDISSNVSWSSDIDGLIGSGATFNTSSLSVGNHTIIASVTDSGGLSDDDTIGLSVNPPGSSILVLDESFASDGDLATFYADWSVLDEGTVSGASNWFVSGGQLQQTSNIRSVNTDPDNLAKQGTYLLHNPSLSWADYSVQLSLSSTDNDSIGVMFRYQDSNNYYRFVWNNQDSYRRIEANEGGVFRLVAQDNVPYVVGQTYALNITVQANSINLSIDGIVIFSETDTSFDNGGIALYSWANNGSNYDDLLVESFGNSSVNAVPTVNITAPVNSSNFTLGDSIAFSGTANDTEDGNISAGLVWSSNIDGVIGTTGSFNTSALTEGTHTIIASVTDSGGLSDDDTITLLINVEGFNFTPSVAITAPANGGQFIEGDSITFTANSTDTEDGDISGGLVWSSNIDGLIGSTGSFNTSSLSVGTHTITASVTDSGGLSDNDTVSLAVLTIGSSLQLLNENFNGGDGNVSTVLADWSVLDEGTVSGASNWLVSGAQLQQTSNIRGSNTDPDNLAKPGTYLLHNPSLNWLDYSMQLSLSTTDNDSLGVMFRYQNSNNFYRFVWNNQDSYRRIEANEGGVFRIVAQDNLPYVVGQTYELNITVQANTISLSIDGLVIFSEIDSAFSNGGIALYSWANNGVVFDDLLVVTP